MQIYENNKHYFNRTPPSDIWNNRTKSQQIQRVWIQYIAYCYNTTPSVVHEYCPYFKKIDRVGPVYYMDDCSIEVKIRFEIAYKRTREMLENTMAKRKLIYDIIIRIKNR